MKRFRFTLETVLKVKRQVEEVRKRELARAQMEKLIHCCTYIYYNPRAGELAKRLAEVTPGRLQKCFFGSSGAEAIPTARSRCRACSAPVEVRASCSACSKSPTSVVSRLRSSHTVSRLANTNSQSFGASSRRRSSERDWLRFWRPACGSAFP